jgi:hypothetical protein
MAPLGFSIAADSLVSATTERPRSSQTSPIASYRFCQLLAASVAQHVRMDLHVEAGGRSRPLDHRLKASV